MLSVLRLLAFCSTIQFICGTHQDREALPYLEVELNVHLHHQHNCQPQQRCDIPYKIALLDEQSSLFDLTPSSNVFDGRLRKSIDRHHFGDIALFNITRHTMQMAQTGRHLRLAIRLFGLNANIQDLFLVDYTRAMLSYVKNATQWTKTDDIGVKTVVRRGRMNIFESVNGCACIGYGCYCCEYLDIKELYINDSMCLNITYLPDEYGIAITFDINGIVYFMEKFSARNPPPICFGIPDLKELAAVCIRFTNLTVKDEELYGCVNLLAELVHIHVAQIKLGCFHLKPPIITKSDDNLDQTFKDESRETTLYPIIPIQIDLF